MLNRAFSQAAIESAEHLCVEKVKLLCAALERQSKALKSADMFYAFRCMTVDIITTFCFGKSIHALDAPDFKAPIVLALEASSPIFLRFKYSDLYKNMILKCPPKLSEILSAATAGLVDLQQVRYLSLYSRRLEGPGTSE